MALKKQEFGDDEVAIFDDAVIYKRGKYWHFRMWLSGENKYARKSLKTTNKTTAIEKGKAAYLEIYANTAAGKTYFSISAKDGVDLYVKHRVKDVETGLIVAGRLATIKTHLQHWLNFIGESTKLKELERTDCEDYFYSRVKNKAKVSVKQITVQHEQSTINSCIHYLFKKKEVNISEFEFKKLPKLDSNNEAIRRATFTSKEYIALVRAYRVYCTQRNNKLDDEERIMRQIVRHYVLIAANSGLRVGELRQLRWSDVAVETKKSNVEVRILAKISVRASTSKVRKSRIIYCRGGNYFTRLKNYLKPENENNLIFSENGKEVISKRALLYHFHKVVDLAKIENAKERDLVPYSLRHFMITQRAMSGLSYREIADMCGTSVAQIEKTYYHLNDEIRLTNAMADYKRNANGTISVI